MRKLKALVIVISMAVVLGCGGESEDEVAERGAEGQHAQSEKVDISAKPQGPQTGTAGETDRKSHPAEVKAGDGEPVDVNDDSFRREVLDSGFLVIVDFWAPWCGPCRMAAPVLERLALEYKGKLKVCKLNVDNARQTAMNYRIRSIPTLIFFKDGQQVDMVVGVRPDYETQLKRKIDSYLSG